MKFTLPGSSEPPSTPDRNHRDPIPSTTPAGPPPSASKSVFGQPTSRSQNSPSTFTTRLSAAKNASKLAPQEASSRGRSFGLLPSSPPRDPMDDTMMEDDNQDSLMGISPGVQNLGGLRSSFLTGALQRGPQDSPGRSPKRQRITDTRQRVREPGPVDVVSFARGVASANGQLRLGGSDAFILGTEKILDNLSTEVSEITDDQQIATVTARELLRLWNKLYPLHPDYILSEEIGPSDGQPLVISASMLAHLLLPLYHPAAGETHGGQKSRHEQVMVLHDGQRQALPKILVEWLKAYHEPGSDVIDMIKDSPSCYADVPEFWDGVVSSVIRGQLPRVITFLRGANYRKTSEKTYTNPQLDYIDEALELILELLEKNPAVQSDDWNITGPSWGIFRRQVAKAQEELRDMLDGDDDNDEDVDRNGLSFGLSRASRAAESRLPQDIYDSLNDVCEMLRGDPYAIKNAAFDWVEASICLTIWWDGEEGGLNQSARHSSNQSTNTRFNKRSGQSRPADVTPTLAYRQQLTDSFRTVLEEEELAEQIDWNNPMHLALTCIFENEVDATLDILKIMNITIASAIADVGTLAGWIPVSSTSALDEQDLMVLSYAEKPSRAGKKDELLQTYAKLLANRKVIEDVNSKSKEEGWYVALGVLSRMNDSKLSSDQATKLVVRIELKSNGQADNVLDSCAQLGFIDQVTLIAVKYADQLAETSSNYGDSLFYYSRGHNAEKLKGLLHTLITFSIIQSSAFPPKAELDDRLKKLLKSPLKAVKELGTTDLEAGQYLSTYLSGYATIRSFYETRDEVMAQGATTDNKTAARVKAAASLVAAISSAADCIHGGLFDPKVDNIIPVDHLLVLLGEALAFINRPSQVLTFQQMTTLLKITEDLETVGGEVMNGCNASFHATISNAKDSCVSPYDSLKKSISNLTTASSQFSLINSSMLHSQILNPPTGTSSTEGSGLLINAPIKRAWDWRKGFRNDSSPKEVLQILRLGLAREIAKGWLSIDFSL